MYVPVDSSRIYQHLGFKIKREHHYEAVFVYFFFSFDMPLINTPCGHLASELKSTSTGCRHRKKLFGKSNLRISFKNLLSVSPSSPSLPPKTVIGKGENEFWVSFQAPFGNDCISKNQDVFGWLHIPKLCVIFSLTPHAVNFWSATLWIKLSLSII